LHCTIQHCTSVHYTERIDTTLHCTTLYCTKRIDTTLFCTALYYTTLYYTLNYCRTCNTQHHQSYGGGDCWASLHWTTLHFTTQYCATVHYSERINTSLHCTSEHCHTCDTQDQQRYSGAGYKDSLHTTTQHCCPAHVTELIDSALHYGSLSHLQYTAVPKVQQGQLLGFIALDYTALHKTVLAYSALY
jgi:hypothetical protein